ncbi:TPA: ABC transporter ATP-binding protein [Clostridioides difficile]|uniref:ABC transporter ATP-binding protein n=1 Tax=Clostridioides difficile TaxID=1496 RepID=UPI001026552C|nr:ABC transporter ATP-binding protein [Clostridioides difficile]VFG91175.1 ABC transporter ATP-binding protein [Clostridioides difficile]VFH05587.1 ABC transporter ATP-binding protein [Clostridioides difficile]VFH07534.1 ABC transporter ATP-binding protein [Clostridioides difficile]HBG9826675.1 ABC transporter ATP-binding protein [Clostridioides difficile]HBG9833223.1 ABC transporter ATP-binding protein [Clostridioides difficile]
MKILYTENLSKHYGKGESLVRALDNVDLEINEGEFVAIIGKSGSGKSTLLHMIGGLDIPTSGKVYIDNKNIFTLKEEELAVFRRRKIGFIFQSYNLIPSLNVWENVMLPIGLDGREVDEPFIKELLKSLGLENKHDVLPNTLSGGQQQRVAIARALATRPAIILADEPTGNLDSKTSDEVMSILKSMSKKYSQTLVMITHDDSIAQMADRVIFIEDGRALKVGDKND